MSVRSLKIKGTPDFLENDITLSLCDVISMKECKTKLALM